MPETTMVVCRLTSLALRRSSRPFTTSPDAAWTTATNEPPSKTGTTTQPHQLPQSKDEGEDNQSNKRPRLDEGEAVEGKVAEEDEDSEPSSDEEDD